MKNLIRLLLLVSLFLIGGTALADSPSKPTDLTITAKFMTRGGNTAEVQKQLVKEGMLVMPKGAKFGFYGPLTKTALEKRAVKKTTPVAPPEVKPANPPHDPIKKIEGESPRVKVSQLAKMEIDVDNIAGTGIHLATYLRMLASNLDKQNHFRASFPTLREIDASFPGAKLPPSVVLAGVNRQKLYEVARSMANWPNADRLAVNTLQIVSAAIPISSPQPRKHPRPPAG